MPEYAPVILSGEEADATALEIALTNELPTRMRRQQELGTTVNSASTTPVSAITVEVSSVSSDEVLVCMARTDYSGDTVGDAIELALFINGTGQAPSRNKVSVITGSATSEGTCTLIRAVENLSGTVTVEVRINRSGGTGTVVAARRTLDVLVMKKRA